VPQARVFVLGVQHEFRRDQHRALAANSGVREVIPPYDAQPGLQGTCKLVAQQGWEQNQSPAMTGALMLIPPRWLGFGELGKHGSIIRRAMDHSFRLSAVMTDAPFAPTPPQNLGV